MASISKVVASGEYSKQFNAWLNYRNRVAGAQLAASPSVTTTPLQVTDGGIQAEPMQDPEVAASDTSSGLSEDVLRIIQSGEPGQTGDSAGGDSGEIGALKSQLAVMEESLLSTELENRELRTRLAMLEEQIRETNRLLRVQNTGLALAEQNAAADAGAAPAPAPAPVPEQDTAETPGSSQPTAGAPEQVRVTSSSSMLEPFNEMLRGDTLWKILLGLAAIVLLIGIIVYIRRRQSYAEFEETMMTGSTYDLRSQSSAFTQVPRMDSLQHSRQSTRADSQQSGSLMQTSFMTEMGAPGMGAMQADEVDPVAEAEVYMAYGRDQQAMEVLQDAIRRDPSRIELKIKLLEVYQKRKDVRAFEAMAEELYPAIGKDAARWGRVTEMGRRISPRHPLFAAAAASATSLGLDSTQASGRARSNLDRDSSGLDLISAPFTRGSPYGASTVDERGIDLPSTGNRAIVDRGVSREASALGPEFDLDADSVSLPYAGGLGTPSTPARSADDAVGGFDAMLGGGSQQMDDFKASEIATKLDLAKAYLEMGDKDAARGFIEEVLKEGNEAQRQQASELANSF
jgi:pilus assembly protein FimV